MSMRNSGAHLLVLSAFLATVHAGEPGPGLGRSITARDLAPWDITAFPSGRGLPPGSGTAAQGAQVFATHCVGCHGLKGEGGLGPALISNRKRQGIDEATVTIANYWPYATTLFDYIRRAMPWQSPHSLTDDQVYALTAFILAGNKLIDPNLRIDAHSLPQVRMPNRDGFIVRFPQLTPSLPPR